MFIPPSTKFVKACLDRFNTTCLYLKVPLEPDQEQNAVLAAFGFDTWGALTKAIANGPPSISDEECTENELKIRRREQSVAIMLSLRMEYPEAEYLVGAWKPTSRSETPIDRRVFSVSDNPDAISAIGPSASGSTCDQLEALCRSALARGAFDEAEQTAVYAISHSDIKHKAVFVETLEALSSHALSAKVNLGVALIAMGTQERDPSRGASILRSVDITSLNPGLRDVVRINLGNFEMGHHGGRKNPMAALKLYEASAAEGSPTGLFLVGMDRFGKGLFQEAETLFRKAIKKGSTQAMFLVTQMMLLGLIRFNRAEAMRFISEIEKSGGDASDLINGMNAIGDH